MYCVFFFQAEDGIRDIGVTGVQTCALPISDRCRDGGARVMSSLDDALAAIWERSRPVGAERLATVEAAAAAPGDAPLGRASCRGRAQISVVAVSLQKKNRVTYCRPHVHPYI